MNRRKWLIFGLVLLFAIAVAVGCGGNQDGEQQPPPDTGDGDDQAAADLDINTLVGQWVESSHSNILLYPAQRDNCVVCHDGGAFAEEITEVAAIERDFFVSTDCRACHTGRGVELMESGTVSVPAKENVKGGTGAQCMACHNERKTPKLEELLAPHASSQAGVYTASGGARVEGFEYGSTTAHENLENSCVACHMTEKDGMASHTFRVDDIQAACGQCHQNISDPNLQAGDDYDGNGETQGLQDEVEGLLNIVQEAIVGELDGGTMELGGGRIAFKDADGNDLTEVPAEVYNAAFNHALVSQDGSLGVHNPIYAVQLLQQSYKALTGKDVPGATMR